MSSINNRKNSLATMIDVLKREGPMTQTRLKEHTNLRGSTASYLVNDLKKFGMVMDSGETVQYSGPGKPGNLLQLNNDFAQFIGCYVENNLINVNVVGLDGLTLEHKNVVVKDQREVEETLVETIKGIMTRNSRIKGIGIAMKALVLLDGTIQVKYGEKKNENFRLEGLPQRMNEIFPGIPVIIENDANCAAFLYQQEEKENKMDLLLYLLNTDPFGIGCSILVKGKILKGYQGAAGQYFEKGIKLHRLFQNNQDAGENMERLVVAVLSHMATAAYLIDPKKIVLSGSVFNGMEGKDIQRLEAFIKEYEFPAEVVITKGNHELDPAKGAALIAMNDYISSFIAKAGAR